MLETPRLILRNPTFEDAEAIARHLSNPNIGRFMLEVPNPYTLDDALECVDYYQEEANRNPRTCHGFGLELKSQRGLMGLVELSSDVDFQSAGLGYWLAQEFWRQGLMTEALLRVADFAFQNLGLKYLDVPVILQNKASYRMLIKLFSQLRVTNQGVFESCLVESDERCRKFNLYRLTKKQFV